MSGGLGNDTYVVDNLSDVVTESENAGTDTIEASVTYTLSANVENLALTGNSVINGTGNVLANTIIGNSSNNTLSGGDGNDTLVGGAGNDRLDGGNGTDSMSGGLDNDTYVVDNLADVVIENLNEGTADRVEASIHYKLTDNVENLTLLGSAAIDGTGNELNNTLTGNIGNNRLDGGAGADTLVGGDGDDVLNGDAEDDVIFGGAGSDTIDGGAGNDTASYSGSNAAVIINLTTNTASGGHADGDRLSNIERLIGSSDHGDTLTGNSGVNRLEGGGGNDTLDGGGGTDTLVGGTGNDTYIINNTGVTITENPNEGTTDTVISSINDYTLGANLENLTLNGSATTGTGNTLSNTLTANNFGNTLSGGEGDDALIGGNGNDALNGDAGNDTLRATAGNNTLNGGAGNDTLFAGTGTDALNGGDGNDTFDLRSANTSLAGDRANGDADNDVFIVSEALASTTNVNDQMNGGTGSDTLQFHAKTSGNLNMASLINSSYFKSFEVLDLSKDGIDSVAVISSSFIQGLVDAENSSNLTLMLAKGSNADTYTIAAGENYSIGQNTNSQAVFTFKDSSSVTTAMLTIAYV
jgi:Ca2+-binding RTX toxin-like protein